MPSASLVHTPSETLLALRATLLTRPDLDTVFALRDAGYAGGSTIYAAFEDFIRERDGITPGDLEVGVFFQRAGDFLTNSGWGKTSFSALDDTFCVVEISQCWEAALADQPEPRGCHLTLGMLGAFLERFADYPVAVLEVEGPQTGIDRCRFIAGHTEMVAEYYANLGQHTAEHTTVPSSEVRA